MREEGSKEKLKIYAVGIRINNKQQSMTFSHVLITNAFATLIQDNFAGPDLTTANDWRVTRAASITWVPEGVGQWLAWLRQGRAAKK